jgi:hypothetical protein
LLFSAATSKSIHIVEDRSDDDEEVPKKNGKRTFNPVI